MWIKNLKLHNFRNYFNKEFNFNNKKIIILGPNGTGKTSVLEAIYLLSLGKSFRAKKDRSLININNKESFISGKFFTKAEDELDISLSISAKKKIKVNDKNIERISQLIGRVNMILFCERDIDIIERSPEGRRKFINVLLSQIDNNYLNILIKYHKVLEERNYYLKEKKYDENLIDSYNKNLVNHGTEIIYLRTKYLKDFFSFMKKIVSDNKIISLEDINIKYYNNIIFNQEEKDLLPDKESIKKQFFSKILKNRKKEQEFKFTIMGPHRDDIIFLKKDKYRFMDYSSTGERRLLAIVMKIAEAFFLFKCSKDLPILLLDDIFLELDSRNKKLLLNYINSSENQFFIATTNENEYNSIQDMDIIKL